MIFARTPRLFHYTVPGVALIAVMLLALGGTASAQNMSGRLGSGFGAAGPTGLLTEDEMTHLVEKYPHCVGEATYKSNSHYISPEGGLGWYQIRVQDAYRAGLCAQTVVQAPRSPRAWGFCDFKGPLAARFNIKHEFDLRYTKRGSDAQKLIFIDMARRYETELLRMDYVSPRTYQALNVQIAYPADVMVGLMHLWGTASTSRMLKGNDVTDQNNRSATGTANCLQQCLHNIFIKELKCSI